MTATPIAVLSVQQRGTQQLSSVSRLGGITPIQVGLNFTAMTLTSVTGTFLSTTIAAASNNQTLPQGTINVASTTGFPASGTILVTTTAGVQTVTYTATTPTLFTGCTGGVGEMMTGGSVGEPVTGGTSGASALVAQILVAGATETDRNSTHRASRRIGIGLCSGRSSCWW